jgi:hypothetical protein
LGFDAILRFQHRPDGWYFGGFIGNEMNEHYSATLESRSLRLSGSAKAMAYNQCGQ